MHISDPAFQFQTLLTLGEDEVHLWRIDLATVATAEQRWQKILSADERARAARFHFDRDRRHYSATRALLRTVLASYVASNPEELVFHYSEKEIKWNSTSLTPARRLCWHSPADAPSELTWN
jgi:hypothetical protein